MGTGKGLNDSTGSKNRKDELIVRGVGPACVWSEGVGSGSGGRAERGQGRSDH